MSSTLTGSAVGPRPRRPWRRCLAGTDAAAGEDNLWAMTQGRGGIGVGAGGPALLAIMTTKGRVQEGRAARGPRRARLKRDRVGQLSFSRLGKR